jgi:hypothetical protein
MRRSAMERGRLEELLDPSFETERGGVKVCEPAVQCSFGEQKGTKTAIGAARARQARDEMV